MALRPDEDTCAELQALELVPGERIRASVCALHSPDIAILGLLGFYVRVRCRRRVAVGDELLVEVVPHGDEVRLRCIEGPARGGGGATGLDIRA